jgi:hypothetical protein
LARNITFNGVVYTVPDVGDDSWGLNLTNFFVAIPQGALQKSGGTFTLSADTDFGGTYGLLSSYFKTRGTNPASSGLIRLNLTDTIAFRNNANSADLALAINGSDQLTFNGTAIYPAGITSLTGDVTGTGPGSVAATIASNAVTNSKLRQSLGLSVIGNSTNATANVADITAAVSGGVLASTGSALTFALLTNSNIDPAAAIAYSKLALAASIVNADISGSAAIAYSKLNLATSILNSDISASAAIAYSKLNLTGGILNADINASAAIAYSKLNLTGAILNADLAGSIAFSKLAALTSGNILVGNVSNVAASVAMSGDITISNAGVTAIGSNKVTLAQMAQIATANFLGRTTASTGNVESLTATQATALLNALVGDSGAGGTKGLVPAPAAGDAAAVKFLKADGTWAVPAGAGTVTSVGLTMPAEFSVASSPVTGSGTIAVTKATQSAGTFFCGPQSGSAAVPTFKSLQTPTIQKFTSGSGTYTTATGAFYIRVRMVGAGGGGGGTGTSSDGGTGGTGGNTTFGSSLLVANGGVGGTDSNPGTGGAGGSASLGTGPVGTALSGGTGGTGGAGTTGGINYSGGMGASSPFGGAGANSAGGNGGYSAIANTGSGGGGAGPSTGVFAAGGGGAGGFVDAIIASPSATYSYAIGAAGTAGTAGTSGFTGGAGGSGYIEVTEYYQ